MQCASGGLAFSDFVTKDPSLPPHLGGFLIRGQRGTSIQERFESKGCVLLLAQQNEQQQVPPSDQSVSTAALSVCSGFVTELRFVERIVLTRAECVPSPQWCFSPYPSRPLLTNVLSLQKREAAASPNWGYHPNPAAFLMTMFNVRLGWWLFNTRCSSLAAEALDSPRQEFVWPAPRFAPFQLFKELLSMADDTSRYVCLSDGGHFDNMGLYEPVRRRCYRIVICDSEQDENYYFEGIANAIRKCRIDFGAEITLDLTNLRPVEQTGNYKSHWAEGRIRYPETPPDVKGKESNEGYIIYIKSSLTGIGKYKDAEIPCEPGDIVNFKFSDIHFPHDTTGNQWFRESQFESYRRLGNQVVDEIQQYEMWKNFNLYVICCADCQTVAGV